MTEQEWLTCMDPWPMLEFLRRKASDRKLRLFAVACHRRIWHLIRDRPDSRKTLEFAERLADGLATRNEHHGRAWGKPGSAFSVVLYKAWDAAENSLLLGANTVYDAVLRTDPKKYTEREEALLAAWKDMCHAEALRITNAKFPGDWLEKARAAWMEEQAGQCKLMRDIFAMFSCARVLPNTSWFIPEARHLAQAIYDERAFDRLPLLADTLEDAGCANEDMLNHCRQPGVHVRGCWVLDWLLGKE